MITIKNEGTYYYGGELLSIAEAQGRGLPAPEVAKKGTIAYSIL